jgi:predicted O-methyltransferase YrrM
MEHFYQNIDGWFDFQDIYSDVIRKLPNNAHIVEVGAWKGKSTAYLAVEAINSGKNIKIDVVDIWMTEDKTDKFADNDISGIFKSNLAPVIHAINPMQMPSVEAAKLYKDKSLDFVFVDANHLYQPVKDDLIAWRPKMKDGAIMAGHDYMGTHAPGVKKSS